jgi:hypothetical protein
MARLVRARNQSLRACRLKWAPDCNQSYRIAAMYEPELRGCPDPAPFRVRFTRLTAASGGLPRVWQ